MRDYGILTDAMCLWEACLDTANFRQTLEELGFHGAVEHRHFIAHMVVAANECSDILSDEYMYCWSGCYDWDFCPAYLEVALSYLKARHMVGREVSMDTFGAALSVRAKAFAAMIAGQPIPKLDPEPLVTDEEREALMADAVEETTRTRVTPVCRFCGLSCIERVEATTWNIEEQMWGPTEPVATYVCGRCFGRGEGYDELMEIGRMVTACTECGAEGTAESLLDTKMVYKTAEKDDE